MSGRFRFVVLFSTLGLLVGLALGRRGNRPAAVRVAPAESAVRELRLQDPGLNNGGQRFRVHGKDIELALPESVDGTGGIPDHAHLDPLHPIP